MSGPKSTPPGARGGSTAAKRRIAQQRAAQAAAQKARDRRRRVVIVTSVTVVVALIAGGALALVGLTSGSGGASAKTSASSALPAAIASEVTNVPASVLDKVGAEGSSVVPSAISAPALTSHGKPQILYIGAEYCPYCATERWPMVVALSRFGRFANLGATASDSTDVYPNTQTLSFHGASYTSDHVDFVAKEIEDTQGRPLDKLTSAEQAVLTKYDAPPYVPDATNNPIPFVDIGGRYLISGAEYDPQILQGKTRAQIAAALSDPSSTIGKAVDSTANAITAAICRVTKGAPASVCTAPGVVQAAAKLK